MDTLNRPRGPLPTRVDETPALPQAYHAALDEGLRDLGLDLDHAARTAIDGHARLLIAWTTDINLTAIREPVAVARLHVVDSLSGLLALDAGPVRVADIGSGGGYPGIPLAAALPQARVTLVEATAKKVGFLRVALDAVGLSSRASALAARAETLALGPEPRFDVVVARAVAPLAELVELAFPILEIGGRLIAWKRGAIDLELSAARRASRTLGGGELASHVVAARGLDDHRLIEVRKTGSTPPGFPRDPAVRRRRAL